MIRFSEEGPKGLINKKTPGRPSKFTAEQRCALVKIVEEGPENYVPGLVRWRCIDLVAVVKERFGVECHAATISRILGEMGFSHISPRPQHPKQDDRTIEEYKKLQKPPNWGDQGFGTEHAH